MAITIVPEILGQEAGAAATYAYLFEPLRVRVKESDTSATKLYMNLRVLSTLDGSVVDNSFEYLNMDLIAGNTNITVDLAKIAQQHFNNNIYKIADDADMLTWEKFITEYKYAFRFTTDKTTTPVEVRKVFLIGGRSFNGFTAAVDENQPLTDWDALGVVRPEFDGYDNIDTTLLDPSLANCRPTSVATAPTNGRSVCGGYLYWKSRYGGWMGYGFDINSETPSGSYMGDIESELFTSSALEGGTPFIEPNYTQRETTYNVELKALSVPKDEAEALKSIASAPVVYYSREAGAKLELFRVASVQVPINNLANGVDVSVSLLSVSKSIQNVR